MKRKASSVAVLTLFLFMNILISASNIQIIEAESSTIIVPDDYPTIKEAIEAASAGDTIIVSAGRYVEGQITVYKPLSLIAEGFVVVWGTNILYKSVFYVASDNVTLKGFIIKRSHYGIGLGNVGWCVIEGNSITETYCGIWSRNLGDNNIIKENRITAYDDDAIQLMGPASFNVIEGNEILGKSTDPRFLCAIYLDYYFQRNIIRDNTIVQGGGIFLNWHSSQNIVSDNRIAGNPIGMWDSDSNIIERNTVEDGWGSGINLGDSNYNLIRENTLRNITEDPRPGVRTGSIMLYWGQNYKNTVEKNFIFECHDGILIEESSHTNICDNVVLRCTGRGLAVTASSNHTTIQKNVVLLNQQFDLYWDQTGDSNTWTNNRYQTKNW
ncbi:MAG: right-handed parallel beta-helix repeat-containing protein [Candidatus Bathyarchaeota archaeon]|nr:MAG: right-handed parallel beta-helix repeat-containing protein [Candidatus Bathyarchaeota archaeon]